MDKEYEYVDLGLPSGLKWAKCNVGAANEYDYGKYFQWGDTVGYEGDDAKAHSTWDTVPFNDGNAEYNEDAFNAFNAVKDTVCPNGVLALEYDAARANMGRNWRMPTKENIDELISNTDISESTINGVKGMKYSKKGDTDTYIFIPFAGVCYVGSFFHEGRYGFLWSSTLNSGKYAYNLNCNNMNMGTDSYTHYLGFSVRYGFYDKYVLNPNNFGNTYTDCDRRLYGFSVRGVSE